MKPTGQAVAEQMFQLIGTPYEELDCQAAIEEAVNRAGGSMDYRGSNDMARNLAWLGTLSNAKRILGDPLPVGAALLIHEEESESTPERYRGDGLGDFTHIGLYAGTDHQMGRDGFWGVFGSEYDVIHSSQSRGSVQPSILKNGWTHVGLFKEIDYGIEIEGGVSVSPEAEDILNQGVNEDKLVQTNEGEWVQEQKNRYGVVVSADGNPVKVREAPEKGAIYKYKAPVGTRLQIMGEKNGYYKIIYKGKPRWMMQEFIALEG